MFSRLSESIAALFPGQAGDELKKNIEALIQGHLEQMNLVSREELAVQQKILKRAQEKLAELEKKIEALEKSEE
ncbi:MAG: accessory factor UbiK family protein [Acidiferrobacterales bacterium]|nr:accessory factor UbiK family protein [Acidiferrobacterales bacterium]